MNSAGEKRGWLFLAGGIWLGGLLVWSFVLWVGVLVHARWLLAWPRVFGAAVMDVPGVVIKQPGVLFGLGVLMTAGLVGRAVLRRLFSEAPPAGLSAASGMTLLSLVCVAMGSAGLFRAAVLMPLVTVLAVLGLGDWLYSRKVQAGAEQKVPPLSAAELAGLGVGSLVLFISALNPTLFYDALTYHLSLPRHYLLTGSTAPVIWQPYSYFPSAGELLLGLAMAGGGPLAAQVMLAGVWVVTLLMLRSLAARFISPLAGRFALLLGLGTVGFALSAALVTIDLFVLLLAMGGLFCLCAAQRAGEEGRAEGVRGWLMAWALCAAGTAGVKYTAWITVLGLQALLLLAMAWRRKQTGALRLALAAVGMAVVLLLPWPLRNFLAAGNPIMPVPVSGLFPGLPPAAWEAMQQDAHRVALRWSRFPEIILSPWTMVFSRWDDLAVRWGVASFLGPWLWMGVPLALLAREARVRGLIWAYGVAALVVSLLSFRMMRFAYPAVGVLTVVAAAGLSGWWEEGGRRRGGRAFMAGVLAAGMILAGAVFLRSTANLTGGYAYLRLKGDLDAYLSERARWNAAEVGSGRLQVEAGRVLSEEAVVLFAGETRFLYFPRQAVVPSFLVPNPLIPLLASVGPEAAAQKLHEAGITHLLVHFPELRRLGRQMKHLGITSQGIEQVKDFVGGPWCGLVVEDVEAEAALCALAVEEKK